MRAAGAFGWGRVRVLVPPRSTLLPCILHDSSTPKPKPGTYICLSGFGPGNQGKWVASHPQTITSRPSFSSVSLFSRASSFSFSHRHRTPHPTASLSITSIFHDACNPSNNLSTALFSPLPMPTSVPNLKFKPFSNPSQACLSLSSSIFNQPFFLPNPHSSCCHVVRLENYAYLA